MGFSGINRFVSGIHRFIVWCVCVLKCPVYSQPSASMASTDAFFRLAAESDAVFGRSVAETASSSSAAARLAELLRTITNVLCV